MAEKHEDVPFHLKVNPVSIIMLTGFCTAGSENWPECNLCPRGYYKDQTQSSTGRFAQCTPCPMGGDGKPTTTNGTGSVSVDDCIIRKCGLVHSLFI